MIDIVYDAHPRVSRRIPEGEVYVSSVTIGGLHRLLLRCPYRARTTAMRLPGALWEPSVVGWHLPFSPALVAVIEEGFDGHRLYIEDEETAELWEERFAWEAAQQAKSASELPDLPTRTTAWLHQRRAFHFAQGLNSAGLFLDMGGGKSLVAIGLLDSWGVDNVVILCPKSVMGVWPKQFGLHSSRDWMVWVGDITGSVNRKAHVLAAWLRLAARPRVAIVNYESSWRGGMGGLLLNSEWDCLILDESHKIKAPGGRASKFAAQLRKKSRRALALTGTPQPYGPQDVYAQYRALDPGIFGQNYNRFKNRYFETRPITDKIDKIVGFRDDRAERDFTQKLGSIGIVIRREDMGDAVPTWALPPVERQVQLDSATFKFYAELRKELIAELDEGVVVADNALTRLLRLRQITSGHTKTTEGVVVTVGHEKRSLLADVLDDIPRSEPVCVFGVFHHDLDAIEHVANQAGRPYLELSGRRRDALTSESTLASVSATGNVVVGIQLQSGGVGIDLTRSCYGIYYSVDYNLGNLEQSFKRLDRPGQTRMVTFVHLVAVTPLGGKTVDGATLDALVNRKNINDAVIDAIRSGNG